MIPKSNLRILSLAGKGSVDGVVTVGMLAPLADDDALGAASIFCDASGVTAWCFQ